VLVLESRQELNLKKEADADGAAPAKSAVAQAAPPKKSADSH
jgi:hypothetical protein